MSSKYAVLGAIVGHLTRERRALTAADFRAAYAATRQQPARPRTDAYTPPTFDDAGKAAGAGQPTVTFEWLGWQQLAPEQKRSLIQSGVRILVEDSGMTYAIGELVEDGRSLSTSGENGVGPMARADASPDDQWRRAIQAERRFNGNDGASYLTSTPAERRASDAAARAHADAEMARMDAEHQRRVRLESANDADYAAAAAAERRSGLIGGGR